MATFTHKEIEEYYEDHEDDHISVVLNGLENLIIRGRNKSGIPIYLTKQRIKSVDSLYLKTKRKPHYDSVSDVTDIAGLRILCLFEQDILATHSHLVEVLQTKSYDLIEFKIYNWHDDSYIEKLTDIVKSRFSNHKFDDAKKGSGYKSIHYVVTQTLAGVTWPIEIQLRTLLQDVWGELEHALAYKQGNIHPHIKESFKILSLDLENIDSLMSHLRNIRDREYSIGLFALEDAGPSPPFGYEEHWLPEVFTQDTPLGKAFQEYTAYIEGERDYLNLKGWAENASRLYEAVEQTLQTFRPEDRKQSNVQYWLLMERAYLLFVLSQHDDAKDQYTRAKSKWTDQYMPYFRLGELHFIKGEAVEACKLVDSCEDVLVKLDKNNKVAPTNYIRIETSIAQMYWLMGEQYYGAALRTMEKAEEIYKAHYANLPTNVRPLVERAIANNLCWFNLEMYILAKEVYKQSRDEEDDRMGERAYEEASKRYNDLETLMKKLEDKRANDHDTAAWFCYHTYLRDKRNAAFLEKAKKYCRDGWGLKSQSLHVIHASNLYRGHTQEILSA